MISALTLVEPLVAKLAVTLVETLVGFRGAPPPSCDPRSHFAWGFGCFGWPCVRTGLVEHEGCLDSP